MKKLLYVFLVIILLLIITNPSVTAFKTYLGRDSYSGLKRPVNLFVCAIYKSRADKYFAIAGNFWKLERDKIAQLRIDSAIRADSVRIADSSNMATDTSMHSYKKQWQPPAKDSLISK